MANESVTATTDAAGINERPARFVVFAGRGLSFHVDELDDSQVCEDHAKCLIDVALGAIRAARTVARDHVAVDSGDFGKRIGVSDVLPEVLTCAEFALAMGVELGQEAKARRMEANHGN